MHDPSEIPKQHSTVPTTNRRPPCLFSFIGIQKVPDSPVAGYVWTEGVSGQLRNRLQNYFSWRNNSIIYKRKSSRK